MIGLSAQVKICVLRATVSSCHTRNTASGCTFHVNYTNHLLFITIHLLWMLMKFLSEFGNVVWIACSNHQHYVVYNYCFNSHWKMLAIFSLWVSFLSLKVHAPAVKHTLCVCIQRVREVKQNVIRLWKMICMSEIPLESWVSNVVILSFNWCSY